MLSGFASTRVLRHSDCVLSTACPCGILLAHFRSRGVVFESGLFLFDFELNLRLPFNPLLVACPVLHTHLRLLAVNVELYIP